MPRTAALPELSVDLVQAAQKTRGPLKALPVPELRRREEDYRRFLALVALHPGEPLAPTEAIDEMWHLHMLHPVAYHRDTVGFLGYLLDHDAGFGAVAEERPVLQAFYGRTADRWREAFGGDPAQDPGLEVYGIQPPPTCMTKPKPEPEPEAPSEPEGEPEQDRAA